MRCGPYILATAGHVDHGKSALVKALTGTDPDRLPEERSRGITIDLGFAHLQLESPGSPGDFVDIDLVDVPGHEDFVRNMVAGTGAIDAALLIVAADDGWMPQTEEHLQILIYQGIQRALVVLSKADLRPDRRTMVHEIRQRLSGTPLADAPILETSVISGEGLDALRTALRNLFPGIPPQADRGKPRLPIDRCFELKGVGVVVTGTLSGGRLRRGDSVLIHPAGIHARIRSLQTHNHDVHEALPGSRVGLNLVGADVAHEHIARGQTVTIDSLAEPTIQFDLLLERLHRDSSKPARTLLANFRAILHHGTAWRQAHVQLLEQQQLAIGGQSLARLTISSPLMLLAGDRVILRDPAQRETLAGGIVLDPLPPRRHRGRYAQNHRQLLLERAKLPDDPPTFVATHLARDLIAGIDQISRLCRFSLIELENAAAQLQLRGQIHQVGSFWADANWRQNLIQAAAGAIKSHHQHHPQDSGLPLVELRKTAQRTIRHASESALAAVVRDLIASLNERGYTIPGGSATIRHSTHTPQLPPRLHALGQRILRTLAQHPFNPPSLHDLAPDDASRQALRFLTASGQVVELDSQVVISSEAYARAVSIVCGYIDTHGPTTVSQVKQALCSTRRVVVPLLERMDKERITQRQGDLRVTTEPVSLSHK